MRLTRLLLRGEDAGQSPPSSRTFVRERSPMITFRQINSAGQTSAHDVSQMVISPLQAGNLLQEIKQSGSIREFLFEMTKDGHVYWIGAAVPAGTTDFSKV